MPALVAALFGLLVVVYVAVSRRLDRWNIAAPMVFTLAGTAIGLCHMAQPDPAVVRGVAEFTLALILFHDAAQVRPRQLESDAVVCGRLLLVGLPLTIVLGFGMALLLMPDIGIWLALLVAAALAPTDAGLGAATVLNPVVPVRIRRVLNVESGLNDGLATPVVLFAIAAAAGLTGESGGTVPMALAELAGGVLVGVVIGAGCGRLLAHARRSTQVDPVLLAIATLAVPLAAYYGSVALHSNGFVAAFVAGMAFAAGFTRVARDPESTAPQPGGETAPQPGGETAPQPGGDEPLALTEWLSTALGYAVWGLFGAVGVARLASMVTWAGLAMAIVSLTLLRMVPVALALVGARFKLPTIVFIGWFGPRGLASVIFALIAVEELPQTPELRVAIGTITMTVVLSVILHGATAEPGARRYGRWAAETRPAEELRSSVQPAVGRVRLHGRGRGDAEREAPGADRDSGENQGKSLADDA